MLALSDFAPAGIDGSDAPFIEVPALGRTCFFVSSSQVTGFIIGFF